MDAYIGQKAQLEEKHAELDLKDKKILYLLSHNARLRLKDLSSSLNIPQDTVNYRLNQLIKK